MSQEERYAHYNRDYYIGRACPESQSYDKKILRPGDMGAALCYAFGIDSYAEVCHILGIPQDNPRFLPETTFEAQLEAIKANAKRQPKRVIEAGYGRGELSVAFWCMGDVYCHGVDPSEEAYQIAMQTRKAWTPKEKGPIFVVTPIRESSWWMGQDDEEGICSLNMMGLKEYFDRMGIGKVRSANHIQPADTILFVESIEHIPEAEFAAAWPLMVDMLKKTSGRLIITNWIDYHPIVPDGTGWDHVRLVDDAFYDSLAKEARRTVFRQGSHLVLEF